MKKTWLNYAIILATLSSCASSKTLQRPEPVTDSVSDNRAPAAVTAPMMVLPQDVVRYTGLPKIGKWMLDSRGEVAHWLGLSVDGQRLNEPINVILRVKAKSPDDANEKFLGVLDNTPYYIRMWHSSGYVAYLGNTPLPQFPPLPNRAISDAIAILPNNHGRAFGPAYWNGYYYYIAAFSRENVEIIRNDAGKPRLMHTYSSFARARDEFARSMCQDGEAKFLGYVPLQNAVTNNPAETTGDHDGQAVFLELPEVVPVRIETPGSP